MINSELSTRNKNQAFQCGQVQLKNFNFNFILFFSLNKHDISNSETKSWIAYLKARDTGIRFLIHAKLLNEIKRNKIKKLT